MQAYQFLRRRVVTALVSGAPDSPDFPMRRLNPSAFVGLMVAAVLVGGFAVLGLISPGHATGWRRDGALVVEKETGAKYVYFHGALHPMLNFASARLYAGDGDGAVHLVSRRSLLGVPRTPVQGIRDAPDALPGKDDLVRGPWSVCVRPGTGTIALLGGGRAGARTLGADRGVVVTAAAGGDEYLVWHDRRMRIRDDGVLVPLGFADPAPRVVGAAWLNSLPAGPDVRFPDIPDRGEVAGKVAGKTFRVGQLVVVHNGPQTQYAVALMPGLAPVTPLQAALIRADPDTANAYPDGPVTDIALSPDEFTTAPLAHPLPGNGLPAHPLRPAGGDEDTLCATLADPGRGTVSVWLIARLADGGRKVVSGKASELPLADRVALPPGGGALVKELPQPGVSSGTWFLVTDDGIRYPLGSAKAATALGYGGVKPVGLPPGYLAMLPTGPTLSRAAAAKTVPSSTR